MPALTRDTHRRACHPAGHENSQLRHTLFQHPLHNHKTFYACAESSTARIRRSCSTHVWIHEHGFMNCPYFHIRTCKQSARSYPVASSVIASCLWIHELVTCRLCKLAELCQWIRAQKWALISARDTGTLRFAAATSAYRWTWCDVLGRCQPAGFNSLITAEGCRSC